MVESLIARALGQPTSKLFLDGAESLSYGDLIDRVEKLTTLLAQLSIRPGELVMVAVSNPAQFAEIFLALVVNGIGAVVSNPGMAGAEYRSILETTRPAGIFVDRALIPRLGETSSVYEVRVVVPVNEANPGGLLGRLLGQRAVNEDTEGYPQILRTIPRTSLPSLEEPSLPAWVVNTSGTTTDPKNVLISRGAMRFHLDCLATKLGVTGTSRLLNVIPLIHTDGVVMGPLLAFYTGATWVRPCEFQPQNLPGILDSVYGRRVTHWVTLPVLLGLVLRLGDEYRDCFDTPEFQVLISTAGMLPQNLWQEFEETFDVKIVNEYGLSECATALYSGLDDSNRRVGSIGKPFGCEIRIVNEDGTVISPGEAGELWLRGGSMMDGYINNPDATAGCLSDGWLKTGDLVREDEDGFVYIVGRIKEMISFAGHTIAPSEVVETLMAHPEVSDASVAGIPGGEWGETPVAFVVRKDGSNVAALELEDHCRSCLSEYKVPRDIVFVDELVRTPTGKIKNAMMIEGYQERRNSVSGTTQDKVRSIAQSCFRTSSCPGLDASPATEPGWDSLAHMELIMGVEKEFKVRFTTREIMMLDNLGGLVELVGRRSEV